MNRSLWKGPYLGFNNLFATKLKKSVTILRKSKITPQFLGANIRVYNGNKFKNLIITEKMLGQKFGEFSFTRTQFKIKNESKF